ncbi:MAG TPA: RNA polymerase sigma factor [Ktedonobacterales bacterium]|nr:RNA polymerase sigma factor [Ktedonobacterales bacterium]
MPADHRTSGTGDDLAQDEAVLVQKAQADIAAFGPLYAHYVDRIYAYLLTRTGQAGAEEAADLTQQVFLRALDALPRYQARAGSSVAAWLFRIARNAAIDWQRRQHPGRRTVPWEAVPEELHPAAPETADELALRREAIAQAHRLLAILDEATREALLLRFTGQLTQAEIGVVLGISEEAARKRITRALRTLKERYQHDSDDTP